MNSIIKNHIKADECILDGELMVWDKVTEKYTEFGTLKSIANYCKEKKEGKYDEALEKKQVCFIAFDLLYLNNKSIIELPLKERYNLMLQSIRTESKKIEIVEQKQANTTEDLIKLLDESILNKEEGVMIKNLMSPYVPGERKNKWLKIKPEYLKV